VLVVSSHTSSALPRLHAVPLLHSLKLHARALDACSEVGDATVYAVFPDSDFTIETATGFLKLRRRVWTLLDDPHSSRAAFAVALLLIGEAARPWACRLGRRDDTAAASDELHGKMGGNEWTGSCGGLAVLW
jgi:hypothetical protein